MGSIMQAYAEQYMGERLAGKSPAEQCDVIIEVIREEMEHGPNLFMIAKALDFFDAENLYYLDADAIDLFRESAKIGGEAVWGDFADGLEEVSGYSSDEEDMVEKKKTIHVLMSEC